EVVFTTHTPVAAGHEVHGHELVVHQGAHLGFGAAELGAIGGDPFSMTIAGLRLSSVTNAVSELPAQTARRMGSDADAPRAIVAVTNGVHPWTWQDVRIRVAYANGDLWGAHQALKRELLAIVRGRTGVVLDEERPVFGFARRAAAYKRADLLLRDLDRIGPLLRARRLQLVFAGKAHPHDEPGKRILAQLAPAARTLPESLAS